MELYVSKTSQQNMPVEFNIYYSRSKTLVGIVFWICMMGVFIALAVNMATDPEEPKTGGAVFMGLICCGSLLFIVRLARTFLSAAKPQSPSVVKVFASVMANSRPGQISPKTPGIHRALTSSRPPPVLRLCCMKASRSISPPRLLRFLPIGILRCAIFTRLRRSGNYLRLITASFFWPAILMLKWAEKREI